MSDHFSGKLVSVGVGVPMRKPVPAAPPPPVGTSPGTGDIRAWFDMNDTIPGNGVIDSAGITNASTEFGPPTYVTGSSPE